MAKKKSAAPRTWLAHNHDGTRQLFVAYDEPVFNHELNLFAVESAAALVACVRLPHSTYSCPPGACVELQPKAVAPVDVQDAARRVVQDADALVRYHREPCTQHLYNAHAQCQWCHRMRSEIDAELLARYVQQLSE